MADKRKIGAYILIKIARVSPEPLRRKYPRLGVKAAHSVTGMFDVIAFIEAADINNLTGVVRTRVQASDGVFWAHIAVVGELVTAGD